MTTNCMIFIVLGSLVFFGSPLFGQSPDGIGINHVLVLEPGESDTIAPAIKLERLAEYTEVQFPPVVHVHRMFYSKTEKIQGPLVNGGQHVVVAKHPLTGETCYVEVMLPVGAPEIRYEPTSISYLYADQRIEIKFVRSILGSRSYKVSHARRDKPLSRILDIKRLASRNFRSRLETSTSTSNLRSAFTEAREYSAGLSESFGRLGQKAKDQFSQSVEALPGISDLKELGAGRLGQLPFKGLFERSPLR